MITLYTIGCPTCKVLEKKLQQKGIPFETITDTDKVVEVGRNAGIKSAPILQVDDNYYSFADAVKYLKTLED